MKFIRVNLKEKDLEILINTDHLAMVNEENGTTTIVFNNGNQVNVIQTLSQIQARIEK